MRTGAIVKVGLALVVAVLLVVLVSQNTSTVDVELFFWTVRGPLVILVAVTGVLGIALGVLLSRLFSRT